MARSRSCDRDRDPTYELKPGRRLAGKYVVESFLGAGVEGEVYRVVEDRTAIPRAVKLFYPTRRDAPRSGSSTKSSPNKAAVSWYAKKLHALRQCPVVVQYHSTESLRLKGNEVECLVSELVEGEQLSALLNRRRGALHHEEALRILYELAKGLEPVHAARQYHGDIHLDNILYSRRGVHVGLKLLDFHRHPLTAQRNIFEDTAQMIRVFYDLLGGRKRYAKQVPEVKAICLGLRRDLIRERFPTARALRRHLDTFEWTT